MTAHVKVAGSPEEISEIHVKVGGVIQAVQEGWVKIGGVIQQFYSAVPSPTGTVDLSALDSDHYFDYGTPPSPAVQISFLQNGTIVVTNGVTGSPGVIGTWLASGTAGDGVANAFYISFELLAGSMGDMGSSGFSPGSGNSLDDPASVSLVLQDSANGTSATIAAYITWNNGGPVLATATFTLETVVA